MRMFIAAAAAAASLSAAVPAAAHPADAALNRIYDRIATAVAANSGEGIAGALAADAVILDPRPVAPAAGEAFRANIRRMADRMKADGAQVRSEYRIERRIISGDVAVDTGYRRMTMTPAAGAAGGPPPQYHKFIVVAQRQPDGSWKIVRDASLPASREVWDAAVRTEGLKYDG